MKILPLLEKLYDTDQSEQQYKGRLRKSRERDSSKLLGRGGHGAVSSTTDPHMVRKHNIQPYGKTGAAGADGYNKFIELLISQEIDNPHFPRVYNIKKITDANGNHIHTYQIEKLEEFYENVTPDLLNAFMEHNLTEKARADFGLTRDVTKPQDVDYRLDMIARMMSEWVMEGSTRPLLMKSMQDAVHVLHWMYNKIGMLDMFGANLMWRRSGTGLTLVFNDPFY